VALAFGVVVLAMIEAVGDRSGAHLNPAVPLCRWLRGAECCVAAADAAPGVSSRSS